MLTLKDKIRKRIWPTLAVILALGGVACGGSDQTATDTEPTTNGEDTEQAAVDGDATEEFDVRLSGAGASFPAPLYQRWFSAINEEYPGLEVSYQSVGSGAGVEQYLSGTVDFGASDAPLTDEEREEFADEYGSDPLQFPMVGGSVVFAYNLEGVDNLELPARLTAASLPATLPAGTTLSSPRPTPTSTCPTRRLTGYTVPMGVVRPSSLRTTLILLAQIGKQGLLRVWTGPRVLVVRVTKVLPPR